MFPLAIGGTITTDRVCKPCNDMLGSRVDSALADFLTVRMRRAELGLAGNSGTPPAPYEWLLGDAELIGPGGGRLRTQFNKVTQKLEHRVIYSAVDSVLNGQKNRMITIDAGDKDRIPLIIQRERKRHGLQPLVEDELRAAVATSTMNRVDNPLIKKTLRVDFDFVPHAMIKIAYELAFLWLGEDYLADPLAAQIRTAICDPNPKATDKLHSVIEASSQSAAFRLWAPHRAHHMAYAIPLRARPGSPEVSDRDMFIAIRIFDLFAAVVLVTKNSDRYINSVSDHVKLRCLAIDAPSGATTNTTFSKETLRMALAMRTYGCGVPIPDPLMPTVD